MKSLDKSDDGYSDLGSSLEAIESTERRVHPISQYVSSYEEVGNAVGDNNSKAEVGTSESRSQVSRTTTRQSFVQSLKEISRMITEGAAPPENLVGTSKISVLDVPTPDEEQYIVSFDGPDDDMHPFNWPFLKKLMITIIVSLFSFSNSLASAIFTESSQQLMEE